MRILLVLAVGLTCCVVQAAEDDSDSDSAVLEAYNKRMALRQTVYEELKAALPKDGGRAMSARLELDYWYKHGGLIDTHERTAVATIEGNAAEVVFLTVDIPSSHGIAFSMAILLVDKRAVDWASCWTSNRTEHQQLLLQDVDGDGKPDVAFRTRNWGELIDERLYGRSHDARWLYAYRVTSKGFLSLLPNRDREVKMDVSCDTADQPVALQVKGIPETLRERQLVECTLSLTNQSDKELAIEPGKWFAHDEKKNGGIRLMAYSVVDRRVALKPGETVSQAIRFYIESKDAEVKLCWKYVPPLVAP
jgi:hypothetical protein